MRHPRNAAIEVETMSEVKGSAYIHVMVARASRLLPIISCFAFFLLAAACKKEAEVAETEEEQPPSTGPLAIVAGDSGSMDITSFDTVFVNYDFFGSTRSFSMNLDGEGNPDMTILIRTWHSLGEGGQAIMWMKRLNPGLSIDGHVETDTVFYRADTTLEYNAQWTPPYRLTATYTYGCGVVGDIQTVYENGFRPRLYTQGETMDTTSYAEADSILMAWMPVLYLSPLGYGYYNDTTDIGNSVARLNNCFVIPQDVPQYIGFAIQADGISRKGWLGFEIQNYNQIAISVAAMAP
ncbi:MAG: hypothetical protein IPP33_12740 [Flavobacteriales bacterium]|nr:hypothetical protein [Flavobacteriales bacterium]